MAEFELRRPLLTRKGRLAAPGWSPEDIFTYNKEDMPFASRRREWEFYQISNPRFAFRMSVAHGPGAGRAEAVLTDFETGEKVHSGKLKLFPGDSMDLDFAPGEPHGVKYEDDKLLLSMGYDGQTRRIVVRSDRFDAQFTVPDTGDAMVTAVPLDRWKRFLYQYKKVFPAVSGYLHMHKLDYALDGTMMVYAGSRGLLPYSTRRVWCAGTVDDAENAVAVNLGEDYGPDDAATENAFFVGDRAQKLGKVYFKHHKDDLTAPWRISDGGRRLELIFRPEHEELDKVNFLAAEVRRHRLFGRANGRLRLSDDREVTVEDAWFFVELADDRW